MKKYLKSAWRITSFVAIILVLLFVSSLVLQPKSNRKSDGMSDSSANGILGEPKNTIDVIFIGDSDAYSSFIPLKIWKDKGITSYVCATPAQRLCYSAEFLEKAFKTQKPKLVILETNAVFRPVSFIDGIKQFTEERFSVFRYHNRWKTLKLKDFSFGVDSMGTELNKGYIFSTGISPSPDTDYMTKTAAPASVTVKNNFYVERIISMCEKNGAGLVFVSTPSTKNWNKNKHDSMVKYAEKLEHDFIDLNTADEIEIDWSKDTKDKGDHLNYSGAIKVTRYMESYFEETGLFTDKRSNKDYGEWNDAVAQFTKSSGVDL